MPTMQAFVNAPLQGSLAGQPENPTSKLVAEASRNGSKMGNALGGDAEKKVKEFEPIIERCYENHFKENEREEMRLADFYRLVCETVE